MFTPNMAILGVIIFAVNGEDKLESFGFIRNEIFSFSVSFK